MQEFINGIYEGILGIGFLEAFVFISGLAYVLLARKQSHWCWPVGLINVVLLLILSIQGTLYADAALQVVYFVLTLYGWWYWIKSPANRQKAGQTTELLDASETKSSETPITTTSLRQWLILIAVGLVLTVVMFFVLKNYTNTDVPLGDAFTTAYSLVGTWMLAKKKLENWIIWMIVDPVYVGIYYYKGWYLLCLLMLIYTFISLSGYLKWKKAHRAH